MDTSGLQAYSLYALLLPFIAWLLIGLIVGLLANKVIRRGYDTVGNIIVGIVGALIGGFLAGRLGLGAGTIIVAFIGAVILIATHRAVAGKPKAKRCLSCNTQLRDRDRFCPHCGYNTFLSMVKGPSPVGASARSTPTIYSTGRDTSSSDPTFISPPKAQCLYCQMQIQPDDSFCGNCGRHTSPPIGRTQMPGQ